MANERSSGFADERLWNGSRRCSWTVSSLGPRRLRRLSRFSVRRRLLARNRAPQHRKCRALLTHDGVGTVSCGLDWPFSRGRHMMLDPQTTTLLRAILDEVCGDVGKYESGVRTRVASALLAAASQGSQSIDDLRETGQEALRHAPTMWR